MTISVLFLKTLVEPLYLQVSTWWMFRWVIVSLLIFFEIQWLLGLIWFLNRRYWVNLIVVNMYLMHHLLWILCLCILLLITLFLVITLIIVYGCLLFDSVLCHGLTNPTPHDVLKERLVLQQLPLFLFTCALCWVLNPAYLDHWFCFRKALYEPSLLLLLKWGLSFHNVDR